MLVSVIETDAYLSKAGKIMSVEEREAIVTIISASPMMGDVIPEKVVCGNCAFPCRDGENAAADG